MIFKPLKAPAASCSFLCSIFFLSFYLAFFVFGLFTYDFSKFLYLAYMLMILCNLLSVRVCANVPGRVQACVGVQEIVHVCMVVARACAGVHGHVWVGVGVHECVCRCMQVCAGVRRCMCVCVAGVCGFSNNFEFSEYLLETNVFMQWPLVRILFVF